MPFDAVEDTTQSVVRHLDIVTRDSMHHDKWEQAEAHALPQKAVP